MNKNIKTLKTDFAEAFKHYKNKNFKNAEITCYKILSIDPNHLDSISLLGSKVSLCFLKFNTKGIMSEVMHKISPFFNSEIFSIISSYLLFFFI